MSPPHGPARRGGRPPRLADPFFRERETLGQEVGSRLPFVSKQLESERDVFGESRRRPTSGLHALSPFGTSTNLLGSDPLRAELDQVGYVLPDTDRPAADGRRVRALLEDVTQSPAYLELPARLRAQVRAANPEASEEDVNRHSSALAAKRQRELLGREVSALRRWLTTERARITGGQGGGG